MDMGDHSHHTKCMGWITYVVTLVSTGVHGYRHQLAIIGGTQ